MTTILSVKDVGIQFGDFIALENISFEVKRGDILAIIGPNGAGKTVLFKALLKLLPYDGDITWQSDVTVGYVPQKLAIDPDMPISVLEFLRLKDTDDAHIYSVLSAVGLERSPHFLNTKLGTMSGGELQRVLIAYALLDEPDVLLFDEPTAGIDVGGEETIYSLLDKLHKQMNLTVLLITHDLSVIYRHAGTVLCLNTQKICYGPPQEMLSPENLERLYGPNVAVFKHDHH